MERINFERNTMSNNNFYTPDEVRPQYGEIVPVYQRAFEVPPWNEVSKCVDRQLRCAGGLSSVAVGSLCEACGLCPTRPAYEADELIERFDALGSSRPTAWYLERGDSGLTMAAIAWKATPATIVEEKYADVPAMAEWLPETLGDKPIMWLDEVFADRQLKPRGNLRNFGGFVAGLAQRLDCETVAYRTIEPKMIAAPERDFDDKTSELKDVPDRRRFVTINLREQL